ncbi:hypothetical protein QL285_034740 [Trifolium repens]|nr:hypothetical protein QL285_034740 [Trifolium repens]
MEEKDKKFYSNPSHAKNFGQYSPPVPSDLLAKLAALKVNNNGYATQSEQTQTTVNSPMEDVQHQQETKEKKVHRIGYRNDNQQQDQTITMDQTAYGKRQKLEEIQRAGTASQASPRP